MRNWLKWFMRISTPSKFTVIGTIASVIGIFLWFFGDSGDRNYADLSSGDQQTSVSRSNLQSESQNQNSSQVITGSGNLQFNSKAFGDNSDVTINMNSGDDFGAETTIEKENKRYEVGIYKLITGSNPVGFKATVTRPQISSEFSVTEPVIAFDKKKNVYLVKVTQYVPDPKAEGGKRLVEETFESTAAFDEPTVTKLTD